MTFAYSGRPWPDPSVTLPETAALGTWPSAKLLVRVAPSATVTFVAVVVA
ncbi:hypothetical protein [Actinacidiphila alni]|nr:hypothetical protein [Actinacidiphila alni]